LILTRRRRAHQDVPVSHRAYPGIEGEGPFVGGASAEARVNAGRASESERRPALTAYIAVNAGRQA
jgi:hypothetical protein